ncbi:hypothetical protein GEMRC1_007967 [Eukaryota sp. GEM-RC1]
MNLKLFVLVFCLVIFVSAQDCDGCKMVLNAIEGRIRPNMTARQIYVVIHDYCQSASGVQKNVCETLVEPRINTIADLFASRYPPHSDL